MTISSTTHSPEIERATPDYDRWQNEAIRCWENAGRWGIIEAVTGSGKTHVAIKALEKLHRENPAISSLIVAPTVPLMQQWYEKLTNHFPNGPKRVGRIGGGYNDEFRVLPLAYVATIHSGLRRAAKLWQSCWEPRCAGRYPSFLIADECHHYIDAPVWKQILGPEFKWSYRMGLSATIGRYQAEGLGRVVKSYRFHEAHDDGLVPSFDLVNVRVRLTPSELDAYSELSDRISDQLRKVRRCYKYELGYMPPDAPDDWLFRRLQQLMGKCNSGTEPEIEKLFRLMFKRAKIYHMAAEKLNLSEKMAKRFVESRRKILVFFERIAAAEKANDRIPIPTGQRLRKRLSTVPQIWCRTFHSQTTKDEREKILGEFRDRQTGALIVCRSLDEGIDIPDVDGAILVASTQSARQRVQRIGRTLRRGDGIKRPIIVTLYADGTRDECVTDNDQREFEGVARLWPADTENAIDRLDSLLQGNRTEATGNDTDSRRWTYVGEADPAYPSALSYLMRHVRYDHLIKLEYADGTARKGYYRYCMTHAICLKGERAPTDGLVRIFKETM